MKEKNILDKQKNKHKKRIKHVTEYKSQANKQRKS